MARQGRRGSAVLLSLGVVAILTTLGGALLLRALNEDRVGLRSAARQGAFHLAEAGVDRALVNLQTPTDLTDDVTTGALPTGTYAVDNPPQAVGSLQWRVTAHGTSASPSTETRSIEAVVQLSPQSVFQHALFADQSVVISGHAQTDSYDSRWGPYNDDASSPSYNKSQNGNVGTNATTPGGITVGGSIFVEGQLVVGPNVADPASVVSGYDPSFITGTPKVVSQPSLFPMPPVTVPAGLECGDLEVKGNTTVTLSPTGGPLGNGTYCYRELELEGGATFTATGPVIIYLTGELEVQGNATVGAPSTPTDMRFLMSSSAGAVLEEGLEGTITGSTKFYGAIYGPAAELTISGNAEIFGAIVARQVSVSGSAEVHYDQALADQTQISNRYRTALLSWRELAD